MKFLLARTTEVGSRTLIHAALTPSSTTPTNGKYLNKCQVEEESDYVIGEEGQKVQERLWEETVAILKKIDGRVAGVVDGYLKK